MKKAAVVIGVDKTGDLPVLNAAAAGAEKFAAWARGLGYDVELVTDRDGTAVTAAQIKAAVRKFVEPQTYAQLVVYFSGHGILKAPESEFWLLSGAPDDPNEAVNVSASIYLARNSKVPHVIFVSDACRSSTGGTRMGGILGTAIFPNNPVGRPRPVVDRFYASLPGEPAYEVPAPDAVKAFRGLFTNCLIEGLTKRPPKAMEQRTEPAPACWVISGWSMKQYLEWRVPEAAVAVSIRLLQEPDILVESHLPTCLVEFPGYQPRIRKGTAASQAGPPLPSPSVLGLLDFLPGDPRPADLPSIRAVVPALGRPGVLEGVQRVLGAKGRASFETKTGFTVVGARLRWVAAHRLRHDEFEENGADQVRVHWYGRLRPNRSLLLQFDSGVGTVVAIRPGFIGTILVDDGRVVNVSYLPSCPPGDSSAHRREAGEIAKRHAYVAAAARHGLFHLDSSLAPKVASFLRTPGGIDATLGLYAAYAFAQGGEFEAVRSVYDEMAAAPAAVPFDVALLAGRLPDDSPLVGMADVSPFCPMLTQGWALLGPAEQRLAPPVREAHGHLVPSLWTTFDAEAVDFLWHGFESGALS